MGKREIEMIFFNGMDVRKTFHLTDGLLDENRLWKLLYTHR